MAEGRVGVASTCRVAAAARSFDDAARQAEPELRDFVEDLFEVCFWGFVGHLFTWCEGSTNTDTGS